MINHLDQAFHALSDPTRRLMVERLMRGPASMSELAQPHPMSLPAIFQHVKVLEGCGLVRTEKKGRVRTCHFEPKTLRLAEQWIAERRALWEARFDRLGEFLDEQHRSDPDPKKRKPS